MSRHGQPQTRTHLVPVIEVSFRRSGKPTSTLHCDTLRTILREAGGDATGLRHARKAELCRRVDALPLSRTHATTTAARRAKEDQRQAESDFEDSDTDVPIVSKRAVRRAKHSPQPAESYFEDSDTDVPIVSKGTAREAKHDERQTDSDSGESLFFPEPPVQTCDTCLNEYPYDQFPDMKEWSSCEHEQMLCCPDCLIRHINAQVEVCGFDHITCPHPGCDARLSTEQIQTYAGGAVRERHMNWINKKAIENTEQHLGCANVNCTFAGDIDRAMFSWMTCPECQSRTCTECETFWHPGMSHDENMEAIRQQAEEQAARETEDQLSSDFIDRNTKACPRCRNPIEKRGGCDHMTCRAPGCRHEFCWSCFADYVEIRRIGNSAHTPECQWYAGTWDAAIEVEEAAPVLDSDDEMFGDEDED